MRTLAFALCLLAGVVSDARADVALLLGEPYGRFGSFSPTGHASIYLSRVCAESPTRLRRCRPDESGVVISRYHRVGGYDWLAIPLIPYLYGVERAADVPTFASRGEVLTIRDTYRRTHLSDIVPDAEGGAVPRGDWIQLVGAVYDRSIVAFSIGTTSEQDDQLIDTMNAGDNRVRFNLLFRNCADFARDVVHLYYPKALKNSFIADLGLTTPKQLAKSFVRHAERRPEGDLHGFVIPQIPGSRKNSRNARGVLESLVKTKKYAIPLTIIQPWVPVGLAAGYLVSGRFNPHRYVLTSYEPSALEERTRLTAETSLLPE